MTLLKNILKALKVITLLALLGLAVFLTWDIFLKFQSKDSSFTKRQAPLSTLPTISICFDPINNERLKYGKDFNISKYNNNGDYLGKEFSTTVPEIWTVISKYLTLIR